MLDPVGDLLHRATVLVVEDDDDFRETVRATLERHGYRVLATRDALRALTLLASADVDVVALDLGMPVMSGWELLEARAGDPLLASIPVVVMSGDASNREGPWNEYLVKPFGIDRLVQAIERCRRGTTHAEAR